MEIVVNVLIYDNDKNVSSDFVSSNFVDDDIAAFANFGRTFNFAEEG